jgi:Sulfotransferase domain
MSLISKSVLAAVRLFPFLPKDRRKELERRFRGKRELRFLRKVDCVCVSYGKSGRTWIRLMLIHYYQLKYRMRLNPHMRWLTLRAKSPGMPRLRFSHDNYIKDSGTLDDSKEFYRGKKIALIVRHPADVSVSMFFQWKNRMKPAKRWVNDYPTDVNSITLFDFVIDPRWGIPRVIEFLNGWSANWHKIDTFMMMRYEDLRTDPQSNLARLLRFFEGAEPDYAFIAESVAFASFENLQRVEQRSATKFWVSSRLRPTDAANPDSFKVRRGKVGGYRDYFDEAQLAQIETLISDTLDPAFGYSTRPYPADAKKSVQVGT